MYSSNCSSSENASLLMILLPIANYNLPLASFALWKVPENQLTHKDDISCPAIL